MGEDGRRRYRRSTPVTRLRRCVGRIRRSADQAASRLVGWAAPGSDVLDPAAREVEVVRRATARLDQEVGKLEESGYVPPPPAPTVQVGQGATILSRHLPDYQQRYPGQPLDGLVVKKVLPTGQVELGRPDQRGGHVVARKSHLSFRRPRP